MIARLYAFMYDRIGRGSEAAGLQRERVALLAHARGNTVEIGAGTGLNLDHYPPTVTHLTLVEPDRHMRKRLRRRVAKQRPDAAVLDARAESLPVQAASFDTVVVSFVLCSVDDQAAVLDEIARVLRPGGQLLFIEHVRADSPVLAWWQDRLLGPWRRFACGCRCNRATVELMRSCGFEVEASKGAWPAMPPIVRPLMIGRAQPGGLVHD